MAKKPTMLQKIEASPYRDDIRILKKLSEDSDYWGGLIRDRVQMFGSNKERDTVRLDLARVSREALSYWVFLTNKSGSGDENAVSQKTKKMDTEGRAVIEHAKSVYKDKSRAT